MSAIWTKCRGIEKLMIKNNGKAARGIGAEAENLIAAYLEANSHKILDRNFHSRYGELDIVAEESGIIVFIEVKYRKNNAFGTPAEAVTASKRAKIIKTAQAYILAKGLFDRPARFDVAEVYASGEINIIEDAFILDWGQF